MKLIRSYPMWSIKDQYNNNPTTQFEYLATYVKGKNPKLPEDYRFLIQSTNGIKWIIYYENEDDFIPSISIKTIEEVYLKIINPIHIKNSNYNYYLLTKSTQYIKNMIDNCHPKIPIPWTYYERNPIS